LKPYQLLKSIYIQEARYEKKLGGDTSKDGKDEGDTQRLWYHRQLGVALAFPPPLFLVLFYKPYVD
jgi:hypothetical protein